MSVSAAPSFETGPSSRAGAVGARRLAVVTARSTARADGIRDYTHCLMRELEAREDWDVSLTLRLLGGGWEESGGAAPRRTMPAAVRRADMILLQYNPFSYGRRGFAPSLLVELARLRLTRRRPLVALMVHETYVDMKNWRWALMGGWQRLQLRALQELTDVQLCATEAWVGRLAHGRQAGKVHHLPVGSNFPDRRRHRARERRRLGVPADGLVLACFGLHEPGRLESHVWSAVQAIASSARPVILLSLGSGQASDRRHGALRVHTPGFLDDEAVARLLSTADMFLAPYGDGVSTRRTTVMAALQHGIPVVGTDGPLTDALLRQSSDALRLVPVQQRNRFAREVAALAASEEDRIALGRAGRKLYRSRFDWPVLTDRLLETLALAQTAR
jgi:glycosyltransferase involved in cell wall biosynthesis